ncbi:Aste57867_10485 [Aphanomyces stellatus]|uniref:Aste57867_10485 protein n=1 Tax=Aphanomyces stellatus TaxID=120398 RepID=A0A485KQY7_9STRA|nr:hypothetical protein As57867_010445 [Aphanomyces stellatus]VFT87359.1 Aste57867_10485 [Aphanomyces stellatus]
MMQHHLRFPRYTSLDTKCRYAYKNCPNARTTKDNGELHSLCAFHRSKANVVQKIYARKRRLLKRLQREAAADKKAKAAQNQSLHGTAIDPIPYAAATCGGHLTQEEELTEDDVTTLQELFQKLEAE